MNQHEPWSDSTLSALFDEERPDAPMKALDESDLERWQVYQSIRDSMRYGEARASSAFVQRLRVKLEADPEVVKRMHVAAEPANDALFRWKLVAGLSSCVAAGVLAWASWGAATPASQLAHAEQPAMTVPSFATPYPKVETRYVGFSEGLRAQEELEQTGEMLRDPELDEMLRAHGAISSPHAASFFRSATYSHEGL